jgi:glutamate-ammonia-ligase adenylyltransferase
VRKVYDSIFGELKPKSVSQVDWVQGVEWADRDAAQAAWKSLEPDGDVHTTARTQENFQRWQPLFQKELARCARPDVALAGVANFVKAYGARSLLYESLCASPKALGLLVRLFEGSESLGAGLVARPELFEAVAQAELDEPRTVDWHRQALVLPSDEEEAMDAARSYVRGEELRIGLRSLLGLGKIDDYQREVTSLAEICLEWAWCFAGKPDWAWIGLGKLGGEGLSFGSDLDLLVVGEGESAVQKAVQFLTEERASGTLFKVDFRLRPYAEGALAVPAKRYAEYYGKEAQGWEVQSLCRARFVGGAKKVGGEFWPAVEKAWLRRGKEKDFISEMKEMRERIATERVPPGKEEQAYKTARGGLVDVEFAAQGWQMKQGMRESQTQAVLQAMRKLHPTEAGVLIKGLDFWSQIEWWIRLGEGRGGSLLPVRGRDLEWLAARCGERGGKELMDRVRATFAMVRVAYEKVLE